MAFLPMNASSGGGTLTMTQIAGSNSTSARSFNVASVLPDIYQNLTIDNFVLTATRLGFTTTTADNVDDRGYILNAYNASTGVLSCRRSIRIRNGSYAYVEYTVNAVYIT